MPETLPPPGLLAALALDEMAAQVLHQAYRAHLQVPPGFLDWVAGDATRLVESRLRNRLRTQEAAPPDSLPAALRCAVRAWLAPVVVARYPALQPVFPELEMRGQAAGFSMLVRTGRWRCAGAIPCSWRLCDPEG
jgi:hypothetical protein